MTIGYIAMALGVGLLLWMAFAFNGLVLGRNQVNEAWSGIDVQLKRRHDLVPNLVETVGAYAEHESAVLRAVTESRDNAAISSGRRGRQAAEHELSRSLAEVRILSERFPELRASEQFERLQAQLKEVEGEIQYSRRIYNTNVQRYNDRVRGFPGSLVRRLGGFQPRGFFELSPVMSGSYEAAGMPPRQAKREAKTGDESSAAAA
jgi:LemA protein